MKITALLLSLSLFFTGEQEKIRDIEYNGKKVKTTYNVPDTFYGTYKSKKSGYLTLNTDGTGTYNYDIVGFGAEDCKKQPIEIIWGFIVSETGEVVNFEREYGQSYPLLMMSTGETSFQGCRKKVMLDFIMTYKDGTLGVSSSDEWTK